MLCMSVKAALVSLKGSSFLTSPDTDMRTLQLLGSKVINATRYILNFSKKHWYKLYIRSDKYKREFDMHAKKLSMGIQCFQNEFVVSEARRREKQDALNAKAVSDAESKSEVEAAMLKVEEEARKAKESLVVAQVIMKNRARKNSELTEKAEKMVSALAEADRKVKEATEMKAKIAAAKDDEIAALKEQLADVAKAAKEAAREKQAEIDEEEIVVEALKIEVAKEVVEEDDDDDDKDEVVISVLDKLVAGNYAPEEAKELLKDLGEKCGWGVSPDGFVLDYELAEMINGLKREAMELREAMIEEEDETKEEEMFEKAEAYAEKAEEIEEHHRGIMLPTAAALRIAIERMIDWGDAEKRELAQKNADELMAKNADVKKKRDLANDLQAKLNVAKKSSDKAVRKAMLGLKKELRVAKKDATDAEFAAGIFRPDDGEEAEKERLKNIELIKAIMVSAETGENRAKELKWDEEIVGETENKDKDGKQVWSHFRRFAKGGEKDFKKLIFEELKKEGGNGDFIAYTKAIIGSTQKEVEDTMKKVINLRACSAEGKAFTKRIFGVSWVQPPFVFNNELKEAAKEWVKDKAKAREKYGPIGDWDVSEITSFSELFKDASNFNEDLSRWNTSKVTTMSRMFSGASNFNQPLTNFDTSKVTDMSNMFYQASNFNQPLTNFDTSKVTTMSYMFTGASKFNQPLTNFDTSKVTTMYCMFHSASTFNQPLTNFDTSKVTNMQSMFCGASNFNQPLTNFDTSNVTDMHGMFNGASAMESNNKPRGTR